MAQSLLTPALTVFEQMALDEVLAHVNGLAPLLRFYHWTEGPAVTFGYSQFYQAVQGQVPQQSGPLCRRPTGGGLVYHGEDLTFSLIFPSALRPAEIYAQLHGAIEQALRQAQLVESERQGEVPAAAYAPVQQGIPSGCFTCPVQDDLLAGGKKILGGAIRRFGQRVLYQGSLQCEGARTQPAFRRAVAAGAQQVLGVCFQTAAVSQEILQKARSLACEQYQTDGWLKKL